MYKFFFFLGIVLLIMLFLWKKMKMHHYKNIPSPSPSSTPAKPTSGKTPEEYRKLAKKYLKEKRFQEAEECYAKAKELES